MTFYIDKQGGGFSSSLIAFGWAWIVNDLAIQCFGDTGYKIHIKDKGGYYTVACNPELTRDDFAYVGHFIQPARLLKPEDKPPKAPTQTEVEGESSTEDIEEGEGQPTAKRAAKAKPPLPNDYRQIDYRKEKEQTAHYFEFKKNNPNAPASEMPPPPDPHWDTFRAINPAALPGYNNLLLDWRTATHATQADVLTLLFDLFSHAPNDIESAQKIWGKINKDHKLGIEAKTGPLQLYDPDQGKGLNRPKIAGIGPGKISNFWLLEVMKVAGFYECAITRLVQGAKDRKSYVLAPMDIDYQVHRDIMNEFRKSMQVSRLSIGSDIMAIVLYTEAMLQYVERQPNFLDTLFRERRPRNIVSGFHTAYYKDLGNAPATMNLAFIGLPSWIRVSDNESLKQAKEALDEIKRLTYTIDESRGDGYNLLLSLRDFLSSGELMRFLDFTTAYASYCQGNRKAVPLSMKFVENIVVNSQED